MREPIPEDVLKKLKDEKCFSQFFRSSCYFNLRSNDIALTRERAQQLAQFDVDKKLGNMIRSGKLYHGSQVYFLKDCRIIYSSLAFDAPVDDQYFYSVELIFEPRTED